MSEIRTVLERTCRTGGTTMSRRKPAVRVRLDDTGIGELSPEDIRIILRGADDLVTLGGRSALARLLKGSKDKRLRERGLDASPAYGALRDLSIEEITARIDRLILRGYLRLEYDGRFPLLAFTPKGWAIERETFTAEWLAKIDRSLEGTGDPVTPDDLAPLNREVLFELLDRMAASGNRGYIAFLDAWAPHAVKKVRKRIHHVRTLLQRTERPPPTMPTPETRSPDAGRRPESGDRGAGRKAATSALSYS